MAHIRESQDQVSPPRFTAEHINKLQYFEWSIVQCNIMPLTITKVQLSGQQPTTDQTLDKLKGDCSVQITMITILAPFAPLLGTTATNRKRWCSMRRARDRRV
jgi:hypothetical protein